MRKVLALLFVIVVPSQAAWYYLTVAGLGGEPDYEQRFSGLAGEIDKVLKGSSGEVHVYTFSGAEATKQKIQETMGTIAKEAKADDAFVLMLIGHGSFDGVDYKFNIPGPDISAIEFAALCDRIPTKRQLVVNMTSASGGAVVSLQKPGRAIISATKSGTEKNATVFARYWVEALRDPAADADKNETVSALEAFQFADKKTAAFYETQKRLATEHPVIEDTGKGDPVRAPSAENNEGLLAASFSLLRLGAAQKAAADPAKRALLDKKEELEQKIDALKYEKAAMTQSEYTTALRLALLELAHVQEELDK